MSAQRAQYKRKLITKGPLVHYKFGSLFLDQRTVREGW